MGCWNQRDMKGDDMQPRLPDCTLTIFILWFLQVLNPKKLKVLEDWTRKTSTILTQINGQRRYGGPPPDWKGPVPGPGCEVFISQIPRNVFEDRLIPLFQSVAPLYEFRLMMNFSGQNRGFAYAKYGETAHAAAAIQALHQYPLQKGGRLVVRKSTEKKQLCLGNLPSGIGCKKLLLALQLCSDGVESVSLKDAGPKGKDVTALVQYSSHFSASMAKKVLVQDFRKRFGANISVQWMPSNFKLRQEQYEEVSLASPGLNSPSRPADTPPRFQITQPNHLCSHKDPLSSPPPPASLSSPPSQSQPFSRAVGGPVSHVSEVVPLITKRPSVTFHSEVDKLKWLCESHGYGVPLYDLHHHHISPDGYLHISYRVMFPRLPVPVCGTVQILPSISNTTMEAEVHHAVAKQVIKAMWFQD
ncbi:hypothetical protein NFI96_024524 [Prochilodus magdalenae]|nr:hypothetical protein NFI96_024524 [Prochilodus magdalenae]